MKIREQAIDIRTRASGKSRGRTISISRSTRISIGIIWRVIMLFNRWTRSTTRSNIIISTLTIIAKNLIRFRNLFESQSSGVPNGLRRLGVLIRVKFLRQLPECLLDFFLRRASVQAQYLVVIANIHGRLFSPITITAAGDESFAKWSWRRWESLLLQEILESRSFHGMESKLWLLGRKLGSRQKGHRGGAMATSLRPCYRLSLIKLIFFLYYYKKNHIYLPYMLY